MSDKDKPDILWRLRILAEDVERAAPDLLEETLIDAVIEVENLRAELGILDDKDDDPNLGKIH